MQIIRRPNVCFDPKIENQFATDFFSALTLRMKMSFKAKKIIFYLFLKYVWTQF